MAGLVPAIHVFDSGVFSKTWMPATSAGMTVRMVFRWYHMDVEATGPIGGGRNQTA